MRFLRWLIFYFICQQKAAFLPLKSLLDPTVLVELHHVVA